MRVVWDGAFSETTSLGIVSLSMCRALRDAGHEVYVSPWPESDGTVIDRFERYNGQEGDVAIRFCDPRSAELVLSFRNCRHKVPLVYFDGGILERGTVDALQKKLQCIWTASEFTRQVLIQSQLQIPMWALPHGVAATRPPDPQSKHLERLTLIYAAPLGDPRKGADILVDAFRAAFRESDAAELILKDVPAGKRRYNLPNVRQINAIYSRDELISMLATAHYFVIPTRMESFGLLGLEAAAAGTPVIYPLNSACAGYAVQMPDALPLLRGSWINESRGGRPFVHWQPCVKELATLFTWLAHTKHYLKIRPISVWEYSRNHGWAKSAKECERLVGVLDELAKG